MKTLGYPSKAKLVVAVCLVLAAFVLGQHGPPNGFGGGHGSGGGYPGNGGGGYTGGGGGNGGDGGEGQGGGRGEDGFGNGQFGAIGFDISTATHYRTVHGIVASVAMVGLFPLGSMLMRVLPGRIALWVHAIFQVLSLCVYVAGAGLGIYLVRMVQIPLGGGSLLTNEATRYHPIIGLVILAVLLIQPIIGYIHHRRYKKLLRRQSWSYLHIFNGRIAITVGIINGGLGLNLANASAFHKRVYIIVAAVMWGLWMVIAIFSEVRRLRKGRHPETASRRRFAKATTTETRRSEEREAVRYR
ncbi:hypothetical protein B0H66DRAFT_602762 [Apodospora peruviana]|uniref:Cytochrome b561 domain-containing protein n=1 Tax=Apodospora peruviana TaxID=516989 RepID=A0AAE0I4Q4_9PEZI|nr:hypothetical protein B0H66DRAFT_602762 [Apodospora peruviana]